MMCYMILMDEVTVCQQFVVRLVVDEKEDFKNRWIRHFQNKLIQHVEDFIHIFIQRTTMIQKREEVKLYLCV